MYKMKLVINIQYYVYVQCKLYIVYYTLYNVYCTLYSVHCTLYTLQCTLCIV